MAKLGQFGDQYGVLNSLFSGMAFAGILITIFIQSNELQTTKEEFKLQRKQMDEQSDLMSKQVFENTFFNLLKLHIQTLASLEFNKEVLCCFICSEKDSSTGRGVFPSILTLIYVENDTNKTMENYSYFQLSENHIVGHYFRGLYQILRLISDSALNELEKKKYSNVIRAQLSTDELALLYLNCICPEVDSGEFRQLLIKFEMLEHMSLQSSYNGEAFSIAGRPIYTTYTDLMKYMIFENGRLKHSAFGENKNVLSNLKQIKTTHPE